MNIVVAAFAAAAGAFELFILLVWAKLSIFWVLLAVIGTGAFGAYFVAREGAIVQKQMQEHSQASMDLPPPMLVLEMFMIGIAAALLTGPGIISHLIGIFLVLPKSREKLKMRALEKMMAQAAKRMQQMSQTPPGTA